MKKKLYILLITILALAACQSEAPEAGQPGFNVAQLQLTTTLPLQGGSTPQGGGGQPYFGGQLTLVIQTDDGTEVPLTYKYTPANKWFLDPADQPADFLLQNAKPYPAYAYGWVRVDGYELPVTWVGPLTPVVTGAGAQAELNLTFATACFHITLLGGYGEGEIDCFTVMSWAKHFAWDANRLPIWEDMSSGFDPYTTPRSVKTDANWSFAWELWFNPQIPAAYPPGQTIKAGETLFTLWAFNTDNHLDAKQKYGTDPYTVLAPAALTLEAGKRYNYTLRLDGLSRTATIESCTITEFADGDTQPAKTYRGIATPDELVQFATDVNNGSYDHWKGQDDVVCLLADIDMTGRTDFPMIYGGNPFAGTFDGGGHTITGLTITSTESNAAMFNEIDAEGTVKNLHLRSAAITTTGFDAAGIAFINYGTLSGCTVQGTIEGKTGNAAGIAADNKSIITACGFNGTITTSGIKGGIANDNSSGTITGCYSLTTGALPTAGLYNGTTSGCIAGEENVYTLTDVDLIVMNNALYTADANLHWLFKSSNANDITPMPGQKSEAITITTAQELLNFAAAWNEGRATEWLDADGTIRLGTDITLPAGAQWEPIGKFSPFTGTFDGQGHKVSGLKASTAGGYPANTNFGFFYGIAEGATVKNLIVDVDIDITYDAAGIAYHNFGTITRCGVHGTVNGHTTAGIAYGNVGAITGCYSVAQVTSNRVAGIVYVNSSGTVENNFWYQHPDGNAQFGIRIPENSNTGATPCASVEETLEAAGA